MQKPWIIPSKNVWHQRGSSSPQLQVYGLLVKSMISLRSVAEATITFEKFGDSLKTPQLWKK